MARRHLKPPAVKPRTRYSPRPTFALEVLGDGGTVLCAGVASVWFLFRVLRRVSQGGKQLLMFESSGHPLTPRSLAALNVYLRTGAMRFFQSRRWDDGQEMFNWGEWTQFCHMLGLKFDGKNTGPKLQRPVRYVGRTVVKFPISSPSCSSFELREAQRKKLLWSIHGAHA